MTEADKATSGLRLHKEVVQASDPLRPSHRGPEARRTLQWHRRRDKGSPGKQREANLTCRLFIRRTSSKKSRDSMVGPVRRTPAEERHDVTGERND